MRPLLCLAIILCASSLAAAQAQAQATRTTTVGDGNSELSQSRTERPAPELLRLANRHALGLGIERDMAMAATLRGRACDLGSQWGCFELALMRLYGPRLDSNRLEAERLLVASCAAGFRPACLTLESAGARLRVSAAIQNAADEPNPVPSDDGEVEIALVVTLAILAVLALGGGVTLGILVGEIDGSAIGG